MRHLLFFLAFFLIGCEESLPSLLHTLNPFEKSGELVILAKAGATRTPDPDAAGTAGFDRDLAQMLAQELGLKPRFVIAGSDAELLHRLRRGEANLAAAWQIPVEEQDLPASISYFESQNVLVTHEASLPLIKIDQLAHKTVHVVAGSRQEAALRKLRTRVPGLVIAASPRHHELDLMEGVAARRFEAALVSNAEFEIGNNHFPELQNAIQLGDPKPIVWLFEPDTDQGMIAKANNFLERIRENGELDRLRDRYFGHVDRLTQAATVRFIERMQTVLPRYRPLFQAAQADTGIDWRLLAAVAYQESEWEPLATSRTGVRGMMMLTEETADRLGVGNRLDPEQSIRAGARYINDLREALPAGIGEPDRLWLALAAYNLGMGHLNAARYIARTLNACPDSWYEMKKMLPLLAKPKYYNRLKSGKGRGGEAVIMVENIRVYTDILKRREMSFRPLDIVPGMPEGQPRLSATGR